MTDLLTILGLIAGGLTALGIIWKMGLVPAYRFIRKIEMAHDLVLEFPIWQTEVNKSLKQLESNGGSSLKDVVNTTRTDVGHLKGMFELHINDFERHRLDHNAHAININIEGQG